LNPAAKRRKIDAQLQILFRPYGAHKQVCAGESPVLFRTLTSWDKVSRRYAAKNEKPPALHHSAFPSTAASCLPLSPVGKRDLWPLQNILASPSFPRTIGVNPFETIMPLAERIEIYRQIEQLRGQPLIVYVTSNRPNTHAAIARDAVAEILAQLEMLPANTKALDLLVVSDGGDPSVAWRIVSLIRERVSGFGVLVPQAAFSAATLIALGANEIVMHPHGNLGPTDPQISNSKTGVQFGSEDLAAFINFARDEVKLSEQGALCDLFKEFSKEVGFVGIGVAARSAQLTVSMAEKLLQLHMNDEAGRKKAVQIAQALNKKYFHHGYLLSRTEAKEIGLPITESDPKLDIAMWNIWLDLQQEMKIREPFNPIQVLKESPQCSALFSPVSQAIMPAGLLANFYQQWLQGFMQQNAIQQIPPASFDLIHAVIESCRHSSRCITSGELFASRSPELQIRVSTVVHRAGWLDVAIPQQASDATTVVTSQKQLETNGPHPDQAQNGMAQHAVGTTRKAQSIVSTNKTTSRHKPNSARDKNLVAISV
jgi:hypothetical protein